MRFSVLPSEILDKRMALLMAMLGPGWLGRERVGGVPAPHAVHEWADLERCYGRLVSWLECGLGYVCGSQGRPAGDGTDETAWQNSGFGSGDVPVALVRALRRGLTVSASGVKTYCRVSASDLLDGILPLLAWVYCLNDRRLAADLKGSGPYRCLVLLAGIPGGGKSVVAGLVEVFGRLLAGFPHIQTVGMDGWHLANRAIEGRWMTDESGEVVPLAGRKGSPESFDLDLLTSDIRLLVGQSAPIKLPAYDRGRHDPVGAKVLVDAPIVLLEGNYVGLRAQGWDKLAELAGGSVWLDASVRLAEASMVGRHMFSGRSRSEAESKWRCNDWPNAMMALGCRPQADAVIYLDGARRMRFAHRQ
jgi:pantothenate kinase